MTTLSSILPPISLASATGTLPVGNGGTGVTVSTGTGSVVLSNGPSITLANATGLPLTTGVTGTLPVANGGTGATTLTGVVKGTGTNALTAGTVSLTTEISGTLPVANGGTGATTLAANNVLLGNGTSAVQAVAPGTTGNVLTSNGTTWVSQALAGNSITATATGSISNGAPVSVNSDGTVSTTTGVVGGIGNFTAIETNFAGQVFTYIQSIYSPQGQKIATFYFQSGTAGYILGKVGTFSGGFLSYGTTTAVLGYNTLTLTQRNYVAYSPDVQRIAVFYAFNAGNALYGSLFSISGTSLSNTGNSSIESFNAVPYSISASYNIAAQRFVVTRYDTHFGTAAIVLVSATATTLSFGSSAAIPVTNATASVYDANTQRSVVFYGDKAVVCTISGGGLSLNTAVTYASGGAPSGDNLCAVYDPDSQKIIVVYVVSGVVLARVGTVSGTTISFGTEVTVAASGSVPSVTYDTAAKKVVVTYITGSGSSTTGRLVVGTVSGTSISFTSPITYLNTGNGYTFWSQSATYDTNAQTVVLPYTFRDSSPYDYAQATSYQVPFTSATSFIGFSNAAYTNGQTVTVQTVGAVDDAQTGLVTGQPYYLLPTGALSTTAGSPSVFAGTALSASRILVKG